MTLRRMQVLTQALPPDSELWQQVAAEQERRTAERRAQKLEDRAARFRPQGA